MTAETLRLEYDKKRRILINLRDEGIITEDVYEATLERVKQETFFSVSVMCDIDNLPTTFARAA